MTRNFCGSQAVEIQAQSCSCTSVVKRLLFSLGTAFERRGAFGGLRYRFQHQPARRREADAELFDGPLARYRIGQRFKLDSVAFPGASMVVILACRGDLHPADNFLVRTVADYRSRLDAANSN